MTPASISSFLQTVGPLFVINLTYRTDRRHEFAAQLQLVGLSLDRPDVTLFPAVRPEAAGDFPSIGARGCFLSHLGVLRQAVASGLTSVLICEDDLDFAPDILVRLDSITATLQTMPWDLFYGGYGHPPPEGVSLAPGVIRMDPDHSVDCTHFYVVRAAAISDLIRYLDAMLTRPVGHPDGGVMHYDGALAWFRRAHPNYITLAAVPAIGFQRSSRTDIHDLRWFDRWPGLGAVANILRKLRSHGQRH